MPRRASRTAEGVAAWHAAAAMEGDPNVRGSDQMAIRLLSPKWRLIVRVRPLVWLMVRLYERLIPGAYYYHIARTKYIDECLLDALDNGTEQLVILGAGFDTRAYRFHDALRQVHVFEVDLPDVVAEKRWRVQAALGEIPPWVTYIALDLRHDALVPTLLAHKYNPAVKTMFIWEGVSMYLPAQAVDRVLRSIAEESAAGSSLVFDYILRDAVDGTTKDAAAVKAMRYVAKMGEPYVFGIDPTDIERFLSERGLRLASEMGPEELDDRYLRKMDGKFAGHVYRYWRIVRAAVQ